MKYVRVNEKVFAKTLRIIGPDGGQLGVFPRDLALKKAMEEGLDLVEVAPDANPPVCRIMDFSKYRYEQEKREREAKKHQKQSQLKEIRLTSRIDPHDYETKLNHVIAFLEKRHPVRIRMMFRGREMDHRDIGRRLIDKLIQDVSKVGKIEKDAIMLGRTLILILGPK